MTYGTRYLKAQESTNQNVSTNLQSIILFNCFTTYMVHFMYF